MCINDAKVIIPDIQACNGVIHVIDTVILPPAATQNIVKTAVAAGQFKTLVSLVTKAGLSKTLSDGQWTVFAPTDAAFAKVPKATLAKLSSPCPCSRGCSSTTPLRARFRRATWSP